MLQGTDYGGQPTAYTTFSHPAACLGTAPRSALCPCANGYLCIEIADCHWKCLMTSIPPIPMTVPPSEISAPAVATSSSNLAVPSSNVPLPPASVSSVGGVGPTFSSPGGNQITITSVPAISIPTDQTGGSGGAAPSDTMPGSQGGGGGGAQPSEGSGDGSAILMTITVYALSCPIETTTVWTTDYTTECPATCPT